MEKFIFILGKNYRLALAELDAYLQTPQYQGKIVDFSTISAIVEFDDPIDLDDIGNLMIRLGGVQKIGRMYDFVELETVFKAFPVDIETDRALIYGGRRYIDNTLKDLVFELFPEIKGKSFFIATSIYPESFDDPYYPSVLVKFGLHYFNKFFNKYLKEQGAKKAIYYKYPQENIEKGNLNPIFPHHYFAYKLYEPERAEILYCMTDLGMYIGRTITVVDSNLQKALDADRPFKKFKQTIPPKFGKTLLSLLQLDEPLTDKRILDPFCGSGTILQFAYLMGLQIYGADQKKEQVVGSRKNLLYTADLLGRKIAKEDIQKRIIATDIKLIDQHFTKNYFDGIATEPLLLPYFREFPRYKDLIGIIDEEVIPLYEQLFIQSFNLLKPNSRLALVAPVVFTQDRKQIGLPIHEMATGAGFKAVQILRTDRFDTKENPRYNFDRGYAKNLFDRGTKHLMREFYVFAKPEEKKKH